MTVIQILKKLVGVSAFAEADKASDEAYDIWANNYDNQPGNLMLDLDEVVFTELISSVNLKNKLIADVGCGTGRHWPKLMQAGPARLSGFDVSEGMLAMLKQKFPAAETVKISDDLLADVAGHSYDVIVSTLTVAHIENLEAALGAWCRILKPRGSVFITDFHPVALAHGGRRTFSAGGRKIAIRNFVHPTDDIKAYFLKHGFYIAYETEKLVDETLRHYYDARNAGHVYQRFKGLPMIYGLHFKKL